MLERNGTQRERTPIRASDSDSQKAYVAFTNATEERPSSATAQAAIIAQQCKQYLLDPIILKDAIIADERKIQGIAKTGTARHRIAGLNMEPISPLGAEFVAESVFEIASSFMILGDGSLTYIVNDLHARYRQSGLSRDEASIQESAYRHHAQNMVKRAERISRLVIPH